MFGAITHYKKYFVGMLKLCTKGEAMPEPNGKFSLKMAKSLT
jgi:hypothetical protein